MIKINKRLQMIGDLVDPHSFVLDVGCDHGLLEVYLIQKGVKVTGSDLREGPVNNAKKNLRKYKVFGNIIVADGLDGYTSEDTVIISGMGGLNIINILQRGSAKLRNIDTFILSPNNYVEAVRRYMHRMGYYISNEKLVKDKYIYNIIVFKRGYRFYTKRDYYFGPVLRKNKDKLFEEYFRKDLESKKIIYKMLNKKDHYRKFILNKDVKRIESELK